MSLHELVSQSAQQYPDRPAVIEPGRTPLTYRQLDERAEALACHLGSKGVKPGDRVLIWMAKSVQMVIAMQAVLQLGAVYVPVDGSTPALRAAIIGRDCAAAAVCATGWQLSRISAELGSSVRCVDLDGPLPSAATRPAPRIEPDDPAYILYTSGSTGMPKGVCISHRNAEAFIYWAADELNAQSIDRFANHAALSFDLSVLDLYVALAVGGSVYLIPAEMAYAPVQLVRFVYESQITVWYSVPSALILMIRAGGLLDRPPPASLRAVAFAGEPFPIDYVRRLAKWTDARLLNLYGPTETNVCTFHQVRPSDLLRDRPVPIGTACSGDRVWAERPDGSPARLGEEGELVVDGSTVMMGYWGRPAQRGPYRTGDIVTVLPDGAFDYVGRRDHMVKVRGHRVELGEIEAVIGSHPDIDVAAVLVDGDGARARLIAFLVPSPGRRPGLLTVKRHCADRLPPYMVVDQIHSLPEMPRSANGKADQWKLQEYLAECRGTDP